MRASGLEFRVQELGSRVQGLRFGVGWACSEEYLESREGLRRIDRTSRGYKWFYSEPQKVGTWI